MERLNDGARAPSFIYLVRLAARCQSAEKLGQRLKRRYQRHRARQGNSPYWQ